MSEDHSINVPSLKEVRATVANQITQIVEYYINRNRRSASIKEIVDGIAIENNAEESSVYSTIDPYTENAAKRDSKKPALFRRTASAEYTFNGFSGDPLDLTEQMRFRDPILREAYDIFKSSVKKNGKSSKLEESSMSRKMEWFRQVMMDNPNLMSMARDSHSAREREDAQLAGVMKDIQL